MHNYDFVLVFFGLCLCFAFANASLNVTVHPDQDCDLKSCPGPLRYYKELGCTPIFENATSCCPTRYNCDVWKNLPNDKCLVNGRVYNMHEELGPGEVWDRCMTCHCNRDRFLCVSPQCEFAGDSFEDKCQIVNSKLQCCHHDEICDDTPPSCTVDGRSYKIGEEFRPLAEPEKRCFCNKDYIGVNDESSCIWEKPSWCNNVIHHIWGIRAHCVPVYRHDKSPQVDCNDFIKCPEDDKNYTIQLPEGRGVSTSVTPELENPDKRCKFGRFTMSIGEEFTSSLWVGSYRCSCEIPPVPTCYYTKVTSNE